MSSVRKSMLFLLAAANAAAAWSPRPQPSQSGQKCHATVVSGNSTVSEEVDCPSYCNSGCAAGITIGLVALAAGVCFFAYKYCSSRAPVAAPVILPPPAPPLEVSASGVDTQKQEDEDGEEEAPTYDKLERGEGDKDSESDTASVKSSFSTNSL